ncbi:hypothetical protein DRF62_02295 [Chryseobacterium piscium]|uniref:Uncharacterized protein n=1 Tax=Chryseobacterium piscium TaxID=333702 RepID=A0A3D9BU39_9FLAO|nr:hypothetical protein [Chryseobacterium piscium]REC57008.1 hypothetical protein DRF62_02295 [Chryseobacterium piscium]
MKVKELDIDQEVIINVTPYKYKGIKKVNFTGIGKIQKIVFETNLGNRYDYKYFDINVGNKDLKEVDGKLELK